MKKITGSSVLIITSLCFFIFCGDKSTNGSNSGTPGTPETSLSIVGDWEAEIDLSSINFEKLLVNLSIVNSGSSFQMSVIEGGQANRTIYKHTGTWQLGKNNFRGEDSLYLFGKECHLLNTSENPARMVPLNDSIAKQTIVLDTSGTGNNMWVIPLGSISPIMAMFPPQVSQIIPIIGGIDLLFKRKEKVVIRY